MIPVRPNNDGFINPEYFSQVQTQQVQALIDHATRQLEALNSQERAACLMLWTILARSTAPVVVASLQRGEAARLRGALESLTYAGMVWYDPDLKSILQCPPFSALTTRHMVKAFGWNRAFVCSFLGIPLSLLLYGPNTWLQVKSTCQHSGEELAFRLIMDDEHHLLVEAPPEATDWRVRVVFPEGDAAPPNRAKACHNASIFRSAEDALAHEPSYGEAAVLYTLDEALHIGEYLIHAFKDALSD